MLIPHINFFGLQAQINDTDSPHHGKIGVVCMILPESCFINIDGEEVEFLLYQFNILN